MTRAGERQAVVVSHPRVPPGRLRVGPRNHRLSGIPFRESPHADARPRRARISMVVVHGVSLPPGEFGGPWVDALFRGTLRAGIHPDLDAVRALRVAPHAFIDRRGHIVQYVAFHRRAWHAGVSRFGRRHRCNDISIGIELEGCDAAPFEAVQYRRLAALVRALMRRYPAIAAERIVGHSDIAPGRKTDPGPAFDWIRLLTELEHAP